MAAFAALTCVSVAVLLIAEFRGSRVGAWVAKPLASVGFVGTALGGGALESSYGLWIAVALVLSLVGDVALLVRESRPALLVGMAAFLLGHVAFVIAFLTRGLDVTWGAGALGVLLVPSFAAARWLAPHLPPPFVLPVAAYTAVVTTMAGAAVGAAAHAGEVSVAVGAVMFYVSDLAVARDVFVEKTFWNKAWGLPLYFAGQLVLAASVIS